MNDRREDLPGFRLPESHEKDGARRFFLPIVMSIFNEQVLLKPFPAVTPKRFLIFSACSFPF